MYAVIFRARINKLDDAYFVMAKKMRELAISKYGCIEFTAVTEEQQEIAISYWKDKKSISNWKGDAEHLIAQEMGRKKWYKDYKIQIVEVLSEYTKDKE